MTQSSEVLSVIGLINWKKAFCVLIFTTQPRQETGSVTIMASNSHAPPLPIPISLITGRYFLFSADAITYLRRKHNICGVLVGTLPQIPQQNVFLGLPLELMPEEARLLVEKQMAYVVDDASVHNQGMEVLQQEDKKRYLHELEQLGRQASLAQASQKEQKRDQALQKMQKTKTKQTPRQNGDGQADDKKNDADADDSLFSPSAQPTEEVTSSRASIAAEQPFTLTPASSETLFPKPPAMSPASLPEVNSSYPLYAHLHSHGYFLSPGMRFGCQYLAYPGDPLRFHSHFLVSSAEWDEEVELMDLVAGGRLGTGVKKGYLIGGAENQSDSDHDGSRSKVRTFSFEWAGM